MAVKDYTDIVGWFDFQDIYDQIAEEAPANNFLIAEVGSFLGKSAYYLCKKLTENGKKGAVYCVDIFEPEDAHHAEILKGKDMYFEFLRNLSAYGNMVSAIKGRSTDKNIIEWLSRHKKFDAIYIDAAHDYASVKADLFAYYPLLKSGGIFAGHDYGETTCGVKQAVDEFARWNNLTVEQRVASWFTKKP